MEEFACVCVENRTAITHVCSSMYTGQWDTAEDRAVQTSVPGAQEES